MRALTPPLVLVLVIGCTGSLTAPAETDDDTGAADGGTSALDDAGALAPGQDGGMSTGQDAGRSDGADSGGASGPCAGITCGANASCAPSLGACRCDAGFLETGSACQSIPAGDPAGRSQADVCARWNAGHEVLASPAWTAGAGGCDPGTLHEAGIQDTLRRLNMFRWLAGLEAVSHRSDRQQAMMECAHMMARNGLNHTPPSDWECYTAAGAAAAGRSNLSLGRSEPSSAVNAYMSDRGTPSLGHRRWIIGGQLPNMELGFSGSAQCMGVTASGGSTERPWTAYPNQGFAPIDTAGATWSFHGESLTVREGSHAEVVRVSDGAMMPVESYYPARNFGPVAAMAFNPMGWTPVAGETYRVTIFGTSAGDITYETTLIDC